MPNGDHLGEKKKKEKKKNLKKEDEDRSHASFTWACFTAVASKQGTAPRVSELATSSPSCQHPRRASPALRGPLIGSSHRRNHEARRGQQSIAGRGAGGLRRPTLVPGPHPRSRALVLALSSPGPRPSKGQPWTDVSCLTGSPSRFLKISQAPRPVTGWPHADRLGDGPACSSAPQRGGGHRSIAS